MADTIPVDLDTDGSVIWLDEATGERYTESLPPTPDELEEINARKASAAADAGAPLALIHVDGGIAEEWYTVAGTGKPEVYILDFDREGEADEERADFLEVARETLAIFKARGVDTSGLDSDLDDLDTRADNADYIAIAEYLTVKVVLLNDDGDREVEYGTGKTNDEAVHAAEEAVRIRTGDDSYVMTDWSAG